MLSVSVVLNSLVNDLLLTCLLLTTKLILQANDSLLSCELLRAKLPQCASRLVSQTVTSLGALHTLQTNLGALHTLRCTSQRTLNALQASLLTLDARLQTLKSKTSAELLGLLSLLESLVVALANQLSFCKISILLVKRLLNSLAASAVRALANRLSLILLLG